MNAELKLALSISVPRSAFIVSILAEMTGFEPVKGF